MSSIKRFALSLAAVGITLVTFLASTTGAYAFGLPGITPSGSPAFINGVKVRLNTKNQTIRAWTNGSGRGFTLDHNGTTYEGSGSFTLKGSYGLDADGNFSMNSGGTVQIKGSMESLGISGGGNVLMAANLMTGPGNANLTSSPLLWGFNTDNIFCHSSIEAALGGCTFSESVYISLLEPFLGVEAGSFSTSGTATTTIPVPAAAWLFGSALGLLGWVRRRANAAA